MSDMMPATTTQSSTGLAANVAGALAYLLGPITGILFLVLEKDSQFVRFHAMQSTIFGVIWIGLSIVLSILSTVLAVIPVLGWIVGLLLSFGMMVIGLVIWATQMWKAFQGQEWEMPVAGPLARKQLGSGTV